VVIAGGDNYGQGYSREDAALAPRYLGVRAKIVKSFARIHKANLCNFGIIPLTFKNPRDFDLASLGARFELPDLRQHITSGAAEIPVLIDRKEIVTRLDVSDRQRQHLLAGGVLNFVRVEMENA